MGKGGGKSKGWNSPIQTAWKVQNSQPKVAKDEAGGVIGELPGTITRRGDKYGFIESDDLKSFGFDSVLVNWDELKEFQEGETVVFTAFLTSSGKAQGKDLKPLGEMAQVNVATMAPVATVATAGNVGTVGTVGKGGKGGKGGKVVKDEAGGILGQFVGSITRRGGKYGFLESKQLTDQHGLDSVLINWDELKDFQVGQKVQFTAYLTSQGRAQGKDLKPRGFKMVPDDEAGGVLGEFFGIITRKADKYGFIECDELRALGHDAAMATWEELLPHKQGDTVKFTAYLSSNEKAKAKNLVGTLGLET